MESATDASQPKASVPKEVELPKMPRFPTPTSSRHPRFKIDGDLKTEKHVVEYLETRGVKVNDVKFDYNDVCDYDSYSTCTFYLDTFAKSKLMSNEKRACVVNERLWEVCGIYIK